MPASQPAIHTQKWCQVTEARPARPRPTTWGGRVALGLEWPSQASCRALADSTAGSLEETVPSESIPPARACPL